MFTVSEFAVLVGRREDSILHQLREGKIKGYQTREGSAWRIPETELWRYWSNLYGRPKHGQAEGDDNG